MYVIKREGQSFIQLVRRLAPGTMRGRWSFLTLKTVLAFSKDILWGRHSARNSHSTPRGWCGVENQNSTRIRAVIMDLRFAHYRASNIATFQHIPHIDLPYSRDASFRVLTVPRDP